MLTMGKDPVMLNSAHVLTIQFRTAFYSPNMQSGTCFFFLQFINCFILEATQTSCSYLAMLYGSIAGLCFVRYIRICVVTGGELLLMNKKLLCFSQSV